MEAVERAPYLAAVDATNADRVYVRTAGVATSRLLVSDDGGATFRAVWSGSRMLGFALSQDGKKVYLGGQVDGLNVAATTDFAFAKRSSVQVECLMTSGTTLYVCSNEISGFIVGASDDDGVTFAPKLRLHTVAGPLACPAGAQAGACSAEWPTLRDSLGIVEDAGALRQRDAGSAAPAPAASKCGCRGAGVDAGAQPAASWLAVLATLVASVAARLRTRPSQAAR